MCNPAPQMLLAKDAFREIMVGLDGLFESHSQLSQHYRNQTTSTCAGHQVENIMGLQIFIRLFGVFCTLNGGVDVLHQISKDQEGGEATNTTSICNES